jgi:hypothetical protein
VCRSDARRNGSFVHFNDEKCKVIGAPNCVSDSSYIIVYELRDPTEIMSMQQVGLTSAARMRGIA